MFAVVMSYLNQNIKYLRKQKSFTQSDLAERIGVKRSAIGAYEEQRAEPKLDTIQKLAYLFGSSLDQLINQDLSKGYDAPAVDVEGKTLRILPIVVDAAGREQITVVPVAARAGYSHSYADPEYIADLPKFSLPLPEMYPDRSYRLFQIEGDSMLPIQDGSYVVCEYTEDWRHVKDGACYIVITKSDGIVYKRVWSEAEKHRLSMRSDNTIYDPYHLDLSEVVEIWKSLAFLSFDLPDQEEPKDAGVEQLSNLVLQLRKDVDAMKGN